MWTSCYTSCMWWGWWLEIWTEFTDFLLVLWKAWKLGNFYSSFQKGEESTIISREGSGLEKSIPLTQGWTLATPVTQNIGETTPAPGLAKVLCHWQGHRRVMIRKSWKYVAQCLELDLKQPSGILYSRSYTKQVMVV